MGASESAADSGGWYLVAMGQCGVLIKNRNPVATGVFMRLAELCRDEFPSMGLVESIPAYDSLVLKFAGRVDLELVQSRFETLPVSAVEIPTQSGKPHVLAVDFSAGLDWDLATRHTGIAREEFVESLCCIEFSVAMLGFLPGFVYLDGLTESLHLPRRSSPRQSVSSGAVAIGGGQCGIYRLPCPGGWQILGEVDLGANVSIDQLLGQFRFGDRVKFVSR